MFSSENDNQRESANINFNSSSDQKIEAVPFIHTMKKDLKNLENPDYSKGNYFQPVPSGDNRAAEAKKTTVSPFLSQLGQTNKNEKIIELPKDTEKSDISGEIEEKKGLGKTIILAIAIFIVLAVGIGSYYFWITQADKLDIKGKIGSIFKKSSPSAVITETLPSESSTDNEKNDNVDITAEFPAIFAADKPNYLSLDFENSSPEELKNGLKDYADKVSKSGLFSAVEFIITDAKNNPVAFSDFSKKIGLTLSENILAQLGKNYSLFIYNDQGEMRLGLTVFVVNETSFRSALVQEEINLPESLKTLFLASSYTIEKKVFSESKYREISTKYLNIVSPENLSTDFAIYKNQWVIGTTKMTLRAILDYMDQLNFPLNETDVQPVDNL
jgi:hypothetical protein